MVISVRMISFSAVRPRLPRLYREWAQAWEIPAAGQVNANNASNAWNTGAGQMAGNAGACRESAGDCKKCKGASKDEIKQCQQDAQQQGEYNANAITGNGSRWPGYGANRAAIDGRGHGGARLYDGEENSKKITNNNNNHRCPRPSKWWRRARCKSMAR